MVDTLLVLVCEDLPAALVDTLLRHDQPLKTSTSKRFDDVKENKIGR